MHSRRAMSYLVGNYGHVAGRRALILRSEISGLSANSKSNMNSVTNLESLGPTYRSLDRH